MKKFVRSYNYAPIFSSSQQPKYRRKNLTQLRLQCTSDSIDLTIVNGDFAIPELITPNGDGVNDVFRLFYTGCAENYQLTVFNRWGQKVFTTNEPDRGWDGTVNGEAQNMDTYLYLASFLLNGVQMKEEGQFYLIR